jgi:hypothetical protein
VLNTEKNPKKIPLGYFKKRKENKREIFSEDLAKLESGI